MSALLILTEVIFVLVIPVTDVPRFMWDPVIGPRRLPNQQGTWRLAGEGARYSFNRQGWNHPEDYEIQRDPSEKLVCFVGDSFVEALHVPWAESMSGVAQAKLNRSTRPTRTYSFGCSGFGTGQQYLLLKTYVTSYRPKVVVLFFVQNDPFDSSPYLLPRNTAWGTVLKTEDGLLATSPEPWTRSWFKVAASKSATLRYLRFQGIPKLLASSRQTRSSKVFRRSEGGDGVESLAGPGLSKEARQAATWRHVEACLEGIRDLCEASGAKLLLAYRGDFDRIEAAERGQSAPTIPPQAEDPYCLGSRLFAMGPELVAPMADRLGISYLDLTDALVAEVKGTGEGHAHPGDPHFAKLGHAVAGREIADWIETEWRKDESR